MHNTLRNIGFLALFAFAGLAQAADTSKSVIDDYMAAWNAHDAEKAASYFAEDGEYFDATVGTPQKGRIAARDNVIKVFLSAVPDAKWEMTSEPIVNADGIAFQWKFSGHNTGAWSAETPATGKPLAFEGVSFMRIKDGKITYQGDYYDALGFNKQLGW
ncbi:MAG TPA: nuclear transport factor 2 family protein [Pseudomonas sp.]|nr:nuclear transport factor 2 family protein [Pseudomonas sp.]